MNTQTLPRDQDFRQWGLLGTLVWGIVIAVIFVFIQTLTLVGYGVYVYGDFSEEIIALLEYDGTALSLGTYATFIICTPVLLGIIKLKRRSNIKHYLALNRISLQQVKIWSLVVICLIVLIDSLTYLSGKPIVVEFMTNIYNSTDRIWMLWLALVVAAPIFEELFFRGFLFSGFSATFLGSVGTVLITSVAWAAIHVQYDLYGMFTIFLFGIVLGIARIKTNSLLTTIMMHAIMNFVATVETAIFVAQ